MSEPVAWRHRIGMQNLWGYSEDKSDCEFLIKQSGVKEFELEPLFAAPQTGNGWQPIETAPRDGTKVDLFYPLGVGRVTDSYWLEPMQAWIIDVLIDNETGKETRGISPTHWRHLPPSPKPEINETVG